MRENNYALSRPVAESAPRGLTAARLESRNGSSPAVGDVDGQLRPLAGAVEGEHPERQAGPHYESDGDLALVDLDQADLTEGPPAGDVDQLAGVTRRVGGRDAGLVRAVGRLDDDLQKGAASQVDRSGQAQSTNLGQVPGPVESPGRDPRAKIRTGTAAATAMTAWVTAVRMCATRARSTALASKRTGSTSGGPGSERRGVFAATKAAQMSAVAGVRAALAAALAADRGAAGQGDAVR
jgi:hypothetical protein